MKTYEELVAEAVAAPLAGGHLGYLDGRMELAETPWSYAARAGELVDTTDGPVLDMSTGDATPDLLPDGKYAVVLNRHLPYDASEVRRVLRPDGVFLTEQVGGVDGLAINEALGAPLPDGDAGWALGTARTGLEEAGLQVLASRSAFPERLFHDIGALVYYLRAVPGQVPDFTAEKYDGPLRALHDQMAASGPFRDRAVRFLLEATPA